MTTRFRRLLIMADIEGSSGCWSRRASKFLTPDWARACVAMSRDVDAVVRALFEAGADEIIVKDFHRTGYNLLPELIDRRARIISGYRLGGAPGIGPLPPLEAVLFLGMHAASGTPGFLSHTLTSRLSELVVNGRPMAEVELFAASLAVFGARPVFFSGCPEACRQAEAAIPGIGTYAIDKEAMPGGFDILSWRAGLAMAAAASWDRDDVSPYQPTGPFQAAATLRHGERAAERLARRWGLKCDGATVMVEAENVHQLYRSLIGLCYLTPQIERVLPAALFCYNQVGALGLRWVRRRATRM